MPDIAMQVGFKVIECGACPVVFAVTRAHYDRLSATHETWFCPSGHPRVFGGATEAEQLRARLVSAQSTIATVQEQRDRERRNREAEERRGRALRGHLTRTKNRIAHGVCPCCQRNFSNLARHMTAKHAAYVATAEESR